MPGPEERQAAGALLAILRERIAREGPLPVDAYVRACLFDPAHGYWSRPETIGKAGDFVTAPEISQVYGELIGLWCAVTWQGMGSPSLLRLVELGPGRGTLMRDALRAARAMPAFLDAARVHLVEVSPALRAVQQRTLASSRQKPASTHASAPHPAAGVDPRLRGDDGPIAWHGSVKEVPEGQAIIIANEFLDALPIRQLVFADGEWRERVVDVDASGRLRLVPGPPTAPPVTGLDAAPAPGTVLEVRAGEDALLAQLALRRQPIAALFLDYGPAGAATGDTLQAVRAHAWADPLAAPGLADLTAHVHFDGLAHKARAAGLAVDGPLTQAEFLGRLGIAERASRLMAANPQQAPGIEAAVQRLLSPTGMGTLFKAMAVRSRSLPPLVPFV
ncbi:MAG TPA: SAM-dependent methyltransferase [Hyphomicrobiaceae bacterium]|nr:SAM-dependent methyltransferase [Hyphomicrobiaceae bacterium]